MHDSLVYFDEDFSFPCELQCRSNDILTADNVQTIKCRKYRNLYSLPLMNVCSTIISKQNPSLRVFPTREVFLTTLPRSRPLLYYPLTTHTQTVKANSSFIYFIY